MHERWILEFQKRAGPRLMKLYERPRRTIARDH